MQRRFEAPSWILLREVSSHDQVGTPQRKNGPLITMVFQAWALSKVREVSGLLYYTTDMGLNLERKTAKGPGRDSSVEMDLRVILNCLLSSRLSVASGLHFC